MRRVWLVAILALSACETTAPTAPCAPAPPISSYKSVPASAKARFTRVSRRMEPVAEQICQQSKPGATNFCNFRIGIDTSETRTPNALQTVGQDGCPVILVNTAMLTAVPNDDELAFVIGHEAAHQIADHISKTRASAIVFGALALGTAAQLGLGDVATGMMRDIGISVGARVYSQEHELEADLLGTHITARAGYDPEIGSRFFLRNKSDGGFLSTHPPSSLRRQMVAAEAAKIRASGGDLRLIPLPN